MNIIIIGAGYGGLSLAALLGKNGFNVTVLEKNEDIGGRARTFSQNGFRYDMGPSWYLMPDVFEKYFSNFEKKSEDFFKLKKLDPAYRVFYEDDEIVDVPASKEGMYELFESIEEGSSEKLKKYLEQAKYKYDTAMDKFLYKSYDSLFDFFTPSLMLAGIKLDIFNSLDSHTRKYFKSEKLRKILEYSMVFLGGSPKNTPALYSLMSHVDLEMGVYYPEHGMYDLVKAFETLCLENNVKIIRGEEAKKIVVEDRKAKHVLTKDGNRYDADIIIANADYEHVETKLIEDKYRSYNERYWKKKVMAPSALIFYLGVNKKLDKLKHHNLFLAEDWDKHFDSIFKTKEWPNNPSYYVNCTSKTDNTAPKGSECLFFLVPVAADLKDDKKTRDKMFDKIIENFEEQIGEKIKDNIIEKRIYAHKDFMNDYNAYKGTALGMAHTLFQTAVFRPTMKSKKIKNLFYSGHYTHPGIGVPMVVIASEILAKKIVDLYGRD